MKRLAHPEPTCASPWCDHRLRWWQRGPYCSPTCETDHAAYTGHRAAS